MLTEISRTSGLARMAAAKLCGDAILKALAEGFYEAWKRTRRVRFSRTDLTDAQNMVLDQVMFFDWLRRDPKRENKESLAYWCRRVAEHPEMLTIPGLDGDLERLNKELITHLLETDPATARDVAAKLGAPRTGSPEDTFALFWLGDEAPASALPPGHSLWLSLRVNDKGQWDKLTAEEQLRRVMRLIANPRGRHHLVRTLFRLVLRASERGSEKSVSQERTIPLEAPIDDPRWRGYRPYLANEETGEARLDLPDPNAERFVSDIEEAEEAEQQLERLAAQAKLTSAERIVYQGLRQGKEDAELVSYAEEQGLSPKSVSVLKSRVFSKLRVAANSSVN
ncbi:MAG: hypothetical protein FJZ95_04715 [Chloroflexi bacterium]|nr:hypothetical protein [Chloroflexota bacterium]